MSSDSEEAEQLAPGTIPAKDYDYLLSMPLWSLSAEKVEDLATQMKNKKDTHDQLEALHIHVLWERDLDALSAALDKQEELDEKDRRAHKGMRAEGRQGARGRGRKAAGSAAQRKAAGSTSGPKVLMKKATAINESQ